jgi:hypothetical protein
MDLVGSRLIAPDLVEAGEQVVYPVVDLVLAQCESKEGMGSLFCFMVPIDEQQAAAAAKGAGQLTAFFEPPARCLQRA